jgi:hypothetical protein
LHVANTTLIDQLAIASKVFWDSLNDPLSAMADVDIDALLGPLDERVTRWVQRGKLSSVFSHLVWLCLIRAQEFELPADPPIFEDATFDIESASPLSDHRDAQEQEQLDPPFLKKSWLRTKSVALGNEGYNTERMGDFNAIALSIKRFLNQLAPSHTSLAQDLQRPPTPPKQGRRPSVAGNSGSAEQSLGFLNGTREGHAKNDHVATADTSLSSPNKTFISKQVVNQQPQPTHPYKVPCSAASLSCAKHNTPVAEGTPKSRDLELGLPPPSNSIHLNITSSDTSVSVISSSSCEGVKGTADTAVRVLTAPSSQNINKSDNKALGSLQMERSNSDNTNMFGRQGHHIQCEVGQGQQSTSASTDHHSRHVHSKPQIDKRRDTSRRPKRKAANANIDITRSSHRRRQKFCGNIAPSAVLFDTALNHHRTPSRSSAPIQPVNYNMVEVQGSGPPPHNTQYGSWVSQYPAIDVSGGLSQHTSYYDHPSSATTMVQTQVGINFPYLMLILANLVNPLDRTSASSQNRLVTANLSTSSA